jgi:hypothetical protein
MARNRRRRRRTHPCVAEAGPSADGHRDRPLSRRAARKADQALHPRRRSRLPHVSPTPGTAHHRRQPAVSPDDGDAAADSAQPGQWEVARRRAAIGGATMMTAQWWPWFEFGLVRKVSASSFRPRPSVDGALMTIRRRAEPLIDAADRRRYQAMVHQVFTGRGHGIAQILARRLPPASVRNWLRNNKVGPKALPRDLSAENWAELFELATTRLPSNLPAS